MGSDPDKCSLLWENCCNLRVFCLLGPGFGGTKWVLKSNKSRQKFISLHYTNTIVNSFISTLLYHLVIKWDG
jgi:hypothetical protein